MGQRDSKQYHSSSSSHSPSFVKPPSPRPVDNVEKKPNTKQPKSTTVSHSLSKPHPDSVEILLAKGSNESSFQSHLEQAPVLKVWRIQAVDYNIKALPKLLGCFKEVTALYLSMNDITDMEIICEMTALETLSLDMNKVKEVPKGKPFCYCIVDILLNERSCWKTQALALFQRTIQQNSIRCKRTVYTSSDETFSCKVTRHFRLFDLKFRFVVLMSKFASDRFCFVLF